MSNFKEYFNEIKIWPNIEPVVTTLFKNKDYYIKDENQQPNNSFKDRGLYYQLGYYLTQKKKKFAISSSGNAAISAGMIIPSDSELEIFVGENISEAKLNKLNEIDKQNVTIHKLKKPKFELIKYVNENKDIVNLRGSHDENAWPGYKTIAFELADQLPEIDAIFIPCSSGTSTLGIYKGFEELGKKVAIHVCQTTKVNTIAKHFHQIENTDSSLADSIVDRVANRKNEIVEIVNESGGSGWIVNDDELLHAKKKFEKYTYNSLLSYCAYRQAITEGFNYKHPVLLFSGR